MTGLFLNHVVGNPDPSSFFLDDADWTMPTVIVPSFAPPAASTPAPAPAVVPAPAPAPLLDLSVSSSDPSTPILTQATVV